LAWAPAAPARPRRASQHFDTSLPRVAGRAAVQLRHADLDPKTGVKGIAGIGAYFP
jgi:hypothetical protein